MTLTSVERYPQKTIPAVGHHAVVVGGSIAGLLAARVLSDAFEQVTVVEKDTYPERPKPRRGVPQGAQIHALQEAGRATLEDLFPGFGEDLLSAGGLLLDATSDLKHYMAGGFLANGTERMPGYSATRPLIEHVIRRRIAERPDIRLRTGCRVTEYLTEDDAATVTGVSLGDDGESERVSADLVVDATGRTSRTPQWLAENGYERPRTEHAEIDVRYATVAVSRPPEDRRAILQVASHPNTRGCGVFPVEDDQWLVNVHGVHGDHPPTGREELVAFAETLPISHAADLLAEREWTWEHPEYYPFPSNQRHYYEEIPRFPDRFVTIGDAIASFNPIYGQGMSVAALEAVELHHALAAGGLDSLAHRFFDRAADVVDVAWSMAVGADQQFPETTGPKPRGSDLFNDYFARLARKAHDHSYLRDELMRVVGMERPPRSLLHPRIATKVLAPRAFTA